MKKKEMPTMIGKTFKRYCAIEELVKIVSMCDGRFIIEIHSLGQKPVLSNMSHLELAKGIKTGLYVECFN